jgi:hypothetical protein
MRRVITLAYVGQDSEMFDETCLSVGGAQPTTIFANESSDPHFVKALMKHCATIKDSDIVFLSRKDETIITNKLEYIFADYEQTVKGMREGKNKYVYTAGEVYFSEAIKQQNAKDEVYHPYTGAFIIRGANLKNVLNYADRHKCAIFTAVEATKCTVKVDRGMFFFVFREGRAFMGARMSFHESPSFPPGLLKMSYRDGANNVYHPSVTVRPNLGDKYLIFRDMGYEPDAIKGYTDRSLANTFAQNSVRIGTTVLNWAKGLLG